MEPDIPKKIGRYAVERLLGSGAMGFVYLARDPQLDRAVAVKTLRNLDLDDATRETFMERFRNEARAAARLHHPGIVQVYDVGDDADVGPYVVFEYVPGSTLKQIIRGGGPLAPSEVVHLADQIASALDAAHAADVIHRDIKPDNLLVTKDGRTKLADFGVARVPNAALTREGQFLGTPCYAAPETLREGKYGPHSDLFSFAAVLYEAASGMRAFPGDDALAVATMVIHDEPPPPSGVALPGSRVPREVDVVIMRALSKDPARRYASAAELARALRNAYVAADTLDSNDAAPAAIRPASAPPEWPARAKGGTVAFVAVVLGGLAIGVGLIFAFAPSGFGSLADGDDVDSGVPPVIETTNFASPGDRRRRDGSAEREDAAVALEIPALDAGALAEPDTGAPMTAHDREEAAKDALARARRAIDQGSWDVARAAIDEARRFDPGNPDIAGLAARLPSQ